MRQYEDTAVERRQLSKQVLDLLVQHDANVALVALLGALGELLIRLDVDGGGVEDSLALVRDWLDTNTPLICERYRMLHPN